LTSKNQINMVFTFDLTCLAFFLVLEMMHFSIDLIVALSPGRTRNTMIHLL